MKVVTRSITDKIDAAIKEHGDNIVRIELTNSEFISLLKSDCEFEHTEIKVQEPSNYSGSYVVYRGVCIQTHHSYCE